MARKRSFLHRAALAETARDGLREDVRAASHRAVGRGKELSFNLQAVEGTGWFQAG